MNSKTIGMIIVTAVAILIGAVLAGVLATESQKTTSLTGVSTTLDISPARIAGGALDPGVNLSLPANLVYDGFRTQYGECEVTTIGLQNSTGGLMAATTDYVLDDTANGARVLHVVNVPPLNYSVAGGNSTTLTYSYCASNYVGGWAQTTQQLIPGFFVLAIMIGAAFVIVFILKEYNLT